MSDRCPYCLEDIERGSNHCPRCGEPLTAQAEMALAPQSQVDRMLDLRKARHYAYQALLTSLLGLVPCCWFIAAPFAIGYALYAWHLFAKHQEPPRWTAVAGIVLGVLGLVIWGGLTFFNALLPGWF